MAKKPSDLGARVRAFRDEKRMSLNELASSAGLSKGYLSDLENGNASRPSAETLYEISKTLGVTMLDLLGKELVAEPEKDIPESLRAFADEHDLPEADVRMLASIQFRGERPRSNERWFLIYQTIRNSEPLDDAIADRRTRRRPT